MKSGYPGPALRFVVSHPSGGPIFCQALELAFMVLGHRASRYCYAMNHPRWVGLISFFLGFFVPNALDICLLTDR